MTRISAWLEQTAGLSPAAQAKLLASLAIVFVLWLLRRIVLGVALRRTDDLRMRYQWKKISLWLAVPLGLLFVGRVWFVGIAPVATYLGLLSAGIAIALKDILANLAGWIFILWRRPFAVGDRIQIGGHAGDVIDLRIFQFTLLEIGNWVDADQSTGRIIHVPNGKIITEPLANYTRGFAFIWNEIPITVTFESDWQKAKGLLGEIAGRHTADLSAEAEKRLEESARTFMIFYTTLTPIVYTSVAESGVTLTVRHLCEVRKRRSTTEAIWEDVLRAFSGCDDIDFAYPTKRLYDNRTEGKAGAEPAGRCARPGGGAG
jgi:small-conductance mechanosensitive channel